MTTAAEYVAGTDPNDPGSVFAARIDMQDGKPTVTWTPDLAGDRSYRLWAKKSMDDGEEWTDVTGADDLSAEGLQFFRATVE